MTKALWITLIAYLLFIVARWIFKKFFKSELEGYFYFLSLHANSEKEGWVLRVEAPQDEFDLEVEVTKDGEKKLEERFSLKKGINKINLKVDPNLAGAQLRLVSLDQQVERELKESEV